MKTVALALPHTLNPEQSGEFGDWCTENGLQYQFTGLYADTHQRRSRRQYFMVWNITATDADLVHLKLRWIDDLVDDWSLNDLEKAVAELYWYETEERI